MRKKILTILAVVLGVGAVVFAYDTTKYYRVENGNRLFTSDVAVLGATSLEGANTLTTAAVSTSLSIGDGADITFMDGGSAVVAYQTGAITISGLLPSGTYHVGLSWADSTNDPGKTTWAITTDTLTVTCATATSGTVHAIVIGK